MSRVLGFAADWFRSNVRVILQYSVIFPNSKDDNEKGHARDRGLNKSMSP